MTGFSICGSSCAGMRNIDSKPARNRHLRFLLAHQCMWRQWRRDLAHAQTMTTVDGAEACNVCHGEGADFAVSEVHAENE